MVLHPSTDGSCGLQLLSVLNTKCQIPKRHFLGGFLQQECPCRSGREEGNGFSRLAGYGERPVLKGLVMSLVVFQGSSGWSLLLDNCLLEWLMAPNVVFKQFSHQLFQEWLPYCVEAALHAPGLLGKHCWQVR